MAQRGSDLRRTEKEVQATIAPVKLVYFLHYIHHVRIAWKQSIKFIFYFYFISFIKLEEQTFFMKKKIL